MNKCVGIVILFILVGIFQSATALERTRLGLVKEGEFSLTTGLNYQQGDYGTPDSTSLWRVPISMTYRKTNFSLFASVPLLYATSEGDIIVTNKTSTHKKHTSTSPPSVISEQQTESGIGDIVLSSSYFFTSDFRNEISYRLTGIITLGTADETKGLGTGENDFALEGGAKKNIDEYILSGTIGYEISGDSPSFDYNNVFYGALGLTRQLAMDKQIGSSLFFSQAYSDNREAPLSLSVFYSQPVAKTRYIYLYLSKGLSDGSLDFSAGGTIQFYF